MYRPIISLCWRKISTFYSVQRRNSGPKNANFFAWKKTGWRQCAIVFCVDVHMALTPVHRRPHEPDPSFPLRVDVINGWPLGLLPNTIADSVVFDGSIIRSLCLLCWCVFPCRTTTEPVYTPILFCVLGSDKCYGISRKVRYRFHSSNDG